MRALTLQEIDWVSGGDDTAPQATPDGGGGPQDAGEITVVASKQPVSSSVSTSTQSVSAPQITAGTSVTIQAPALVTTTTTTLNYTGSPPQNPNAPTTAYWTPPGSAQRLSLQ